MFYCQSVCLSVSPADGTCVNGISKVCWIICSGSREEFQLVRQAILFNTVIKSILPTFSLSLNGKEMELDWIRCISNSIMSCSFNTEYQVLLKAKVDEIQQWKKTLSKKFEMSLFFLDTWCLITLLLHVRHRQSCVVGSLFHLNPAFSPALTLDPSCR